LWSSRKGGDEREAFFFARCDAAGDERASERATTSDDEATDRSQCKPPCQSPGSTDPACARPDAIATERRIGRPLDRRPRSGIRRARQKRPKPKEELTACAFLGAASSAAAPAVRMPRLAWRRETAEVTTAPPRGAARAELACAIILFWIEVSVFVLRVRTCASLSLSVWRVCVRNVWIDKARREVLIEGIECIVQGVGDGVGDERRPRPSSFFAAASYRES
jgi:hypothetical protein